MALPSAGLVKRIPRQRTDDEAFYGPEETEKNNHNTRVLVFDE
jgi:hypothetical protein